MSYGGFFHALCKYKTSFLVVISLLMHIVPQMMLHPEKQLFWAWAKITKGRTCGETCAAHQRHQTLLGREQQGQGCKTRTRPSGPGGNTDLEGGCVRRTLSGPRRASSVLEAELGR